MRISRWQPIILLLLAVALLVLCQRPRHGHDEASVWRPQADVTVFTLLEHLDCVKCPVTPKLKMPLPWPHEIRLILPATFDSDIAYSNTSFMACRHCVCIPLRL